MNSRTYILDNAGAEASTRLSALSTIFDASTIDHLRRTGLASGWRCLELGAGNGSIARWLAAEVGTSGHVSATDLDPRHLLPVRTTNLEVLCHDLATDPLPAGAFDLVHARLLLAALPPEVRVVRRAVDALKPGGWLVAEDFETPPLALVGKGAATTASPGTVALRKVLQSHGIDLDYGRRMGDLFRAEGLLSVGMEGRVYVWRDGEAGARLLKANRQQLHRKLLETGLVNEETLAAELAALDDPAVEFTSPILWTAWGRKAA